MATKIIQVGAGNFGQLWLKTLVDFDGAELVALVDPSEASLARAQKEAGVAEAICFRDLSEALSATEAEVALVVTPPRFHREPVVLALEAGLDVMSEKPMADSPEDCRAMLAAAEAARGTYAVSQNYRYGPAMATMARLVREGLIGEIGQVKIDFYLGKDFGGGFRHEMDHPVLVDMSIHHFDLLRYVTGQDAVSVRGESWNPAWSNYQGDASSSLVFRMDGGARVLYNASWCAKGFYCDWSGNWQIEGDKGTLLYREGVMTHIPVPDLYTPGEAVTIAPDDCAEEGLGASLSHFLACRREGRDPQTVATDNAKSVAMVFAAVDAVNTGDRVTVGI